MFITIPYSPRHCSARLCNIWKALPAGDRIDSQRVKRFSLRSQPDQDQTTRLTTARCRWVYCQKDLAKFARSSKPRCNLLSTPRRRAFRQTSVTDQQGSPLHDHAYLLGTGTAAVIRFSSNSAAGWRVATDGQHSHQAAWHCSGNFGIDLGGQGTDMARAWVY